MKQHSTGKYVFAVAFALLILALVFLFQRIETITINDQQLEAGIREALNKPDGPLYLAELSTIESLQLRGRQVQSLEGIQYLVQLVDLDLRDNLITDLSPLSTLKRLQSLNLRNNQIQDIEALNQMQQLQYLNIRDNLIQDIGVLSQLPLLEDVNLRNNLITDIRPLSGLKLLVKRLYLEGNPIEDFTPVAGYYDLIAETDFTLSTESISFSHLGGFYTEGFHLELTVNLPNTLIYYTLDGSEPTRDSQLYTEPIPIQSRAGEPNDLSEIPINDRTDFLQWLPPLDEVFKATVVRAAFYIEDTRVSTMTQTYFVDEDIYTMFQVPVISISTDQAHLFDPATGLFVNQNYTERGREWERPVHFEFYDEHGALGFAQQLGMRIHGSSTRHAPAKSMRMYAREEYGASTVQYQLFSDKPINTFERFILRYRGTDFKDSMQAHLVKDVTDLDVQYYRSAVVFINGEYWGVYKIRDRIDEKYFETHYGITDMDLLENLGDVKAGDNAHYDAFIRFLQQQEDMNAAHVYPYIESMIDIDNFIDYHIAQNFYMNIDQPGKNVDFWRSRTINPDNPKEDGRWRWILFDLDMGFGSYGGTAMNGFIFSTSLLHHGSDEVLSGVQMAEVLPRLPDFSPPATDIGPEATFLLRTLLQNDRIRMQYMNRYADLLNSAFLPKRVQSVIAQMKEEFAPLVDQNARRMGELDEGQFAADVDRLIHFSNRRPIWVREHAVEYFDEITGTAELTLVASAVMGKIQVNSLEASEMWSGIYFTGIPLTLKAIPHEGFVFAGWEQDGQLISTSEQLELVLDNDTLIQAIFTEN